MDTIYIGCDITTAQMRVLPTEDSILDIVEEFMGRESRIKIEDILNDKYMDGYENGWDDCSSGGTYHPNKGDSNLN